MEGGISFWQALTLSSILGWMVASSWFDLTKRIRSLAQPWVTRRVLADTPSILWLQSMRHGSLDCIFSVLSCFVSVPFYTGFLPIVYWSGHRKLARQMTLLMAFCDYIGNSMKDVVSAPRPSCPPVTRVITTNDERGNAMEFGLPSSHCLNAVCLLGYMLHHFLTHGAKMDAVIPVGFLGLACLLIILIGIGRMYLGMHSLIDVVAGIIFGLVILALWLMIHEHVDDFIASGQNVTSFWASLSFLLCFAYPTPEFPTPSFEYHAAFNGVAFGLVGGIHRHLHPQDGGNPSLFSGLPVVVFLGRLSVGIPTILVVKVCSKGAAKWLLPVMCNTLGVPITSSCYVPALKVSQGSTSKSERKQPGCLLKPPSGFPRKAYDVDTGIRFLQYAGLAWSAVAFVPALFSHLNL